MSSITKREDLPGLLVRRYRAIPKLITAIQLDATEDTAGSDTDGQMVSGKPGDWKIFYGANSDGRPAIAICDQDILERFTSMSRAIHTGRNPPSSLRQRNWQNPWIL